MSISKQLLPSKQLLQTKLFLPPGRPGLVLRARLTERLTAALACPFTLVSAPAGFGKTMLLADWALTVRSQAQAGLPGPHFAWLSLDEGDNDPVRFWSYVAAALESARPGVGEAALHALQATQPPPIEALLTGVINELAQTSGETLLVLDDYHIIHAQAIHEALQFLVEHQPANLHLVLLTRSDPPLPLARWRARHRLLEVRTADLRFTPAESTAFLHETMGVSLSVEQVAELETRIEGWIAGLQLAALSMKGQGDFAAFIANFTGSHRFVLDYLMDEVLQRQPPGVQTFLLHTAILDRLHPALCDALTGRQESRALLQQLERENLFLTPLDEAREWWRYHHLFADVLRARLEEQQPEYVLVLHRRAAVWFAQKGLLPEAIHHALAATDFALAAQLIEESADGLLRHGEHHSLRGWLEQLPLSVLDAHPRLLLVHASVLALLHQMERVERALVAAENNVEKAEPALRRRIVGEAAAIRANIASLQDNLPLAVTLAHRALEELPPEEVRRRGEVTFYLGIAYGWQGQVTEAIAAHSQARRLSLAANDLHIALRAMMNLAAMQFICGHFQQSLALCQQTLAWAGEKSVQQMPILCVIYAELGNLYYEFNQLDTAKQYVESAIHYSKRGGLPRYQADGHILMALVLRGQDDLVAAQDAIGQAEQLVEQYQLPLRYRSFATLVKILISLAAGDLVAAGKWAQESGLTTQDELDYPREGERLALAHVLVAQGHYSEAVAFLTRLHLFAETQGRFDRVIQLLALKAKALHLCGERDQALTTLANALALGAPEGYVRTFVDQGEVMKMLLLAFSSGSMKGTSILDGEALLAHVNHLLAAFPTAAITDEITIQNPLSKTQDPGALLSERELEVLSLLAAGATNQEIGEQLIISLNTVKRHVTNIFNKLAVGNRMLAAARAHELGLV